MWFRDFGKLVFVFCDLILGYFLSNLLKKIKNKEFYVALWLLNPLVIAISTRGSND